MIPVELPDSAAWIDSLAPHLSNRDAALLRLAAHTLTANIIQPRPGETLPWAPYRGVIPSPGTYRGIWNWDAAFHAVGIAHWDPALGREQVKIMLEAQLPTGALPDVIFEDGTVVTAFGKPPVMPWALEQIDRMAPDDAFLEYAYAKFVKYAAFWHDHRLDNGLFFYDSREDDPQKRDNHAKLESGWDNSVRWDAGARRLWPVDLNGYMVLLYRAMAYFARRLNHPEDQAHYEALAAGLSERINATLYDPASGCYLDRDRATRAFSPVQSPACFLPLFIQAAPAAQAQSLAAIAADPAKFFPGMPTVAYDDPQFASASYWRGPCWLNTAYFAAKGLKLAGFENTANTIRETILGWCAANPDALYEYYDAISGKGLGARQFGWSAAFVIAFILDWE